MYHFIFNQAASQANIHLYNLSLYIIHIRNAFTNTYLTYRNRSIAPSVWSRLDHISPAANISWNRSLHTEIWRTPRTTDVTRIADTPSSSLTRKGCIRANWRSETVGDLKRKRGGDYVIRLHTIYICIHTNEICIYI